MLATFFVPRGMTWREAIVAHADVIAMARREAGLRHGGRARLLRCFRLIRATQRLRLENLIGIGGPRPPRGGRLVVGLSP